MESPERPPLTPRKRDRCQYCGARVPAWLPAAQAPNGARLLGHLSQPHRDRVGADTARLHTSEDIDRVVEAFELVEE